MIAGRCSSCHTIHGSDAAVVVNRFSGEPARYRSRLGGYPERATRDEAVEDYCRTVQSQMFPVATACECGHIALSHHHSSHGRADDAGCFGAAGVGVKCSCENAAYEVMSPPRGEALTLFEVTP